jgi:hypothetical protein
MSDQTPPAESSASARPPRAHLGWAVAATVACFLPLGLVAVYYGFRTNRAILDGRPDDANRDARVARRWLIATVVVGLFVYLLIAAVFVLLGAFST